MPRAPRTRSPRRASRRRCPARFPQTTGAGAFTIFELVIALAVISIVAAVCITRYFSQEEVTLENATVLLARDLRATQNRCAFLREPATVEFLEDGSGYRTLGPDGRVIHNPSTGRDFVRSYPSDGVFQGVRVSALDLGGGRTIAFDEDGRTRNSGWIELEFAGSRRRVRIEAPSGRIELLGSSSLWFDRGR